MPESPEDRERRADLLERLGDLLGLTASEGDLQLKYLERALKLYRELGDEEAAARVQGRMAISVVGEDVRIGQGLAASQRAMEISEQLGDQVLWARAACTHAYNLCARGHLNQSFALIHRLSEEADRLNDNVAGSGITAVCAEMLMWLCDPVGISAQMERELTKPRILEAPLLRGILTDWLLVFEIPRGNLHEAAVRLRQTHGEPLIEPEMAFYRGTWEQAESVLARAFEQARAGGRRRRSYIYVAWLAKVRRALGQHSVAEAILRDNVAIGIADPHLPFELNARQELALLYAQTQRSEQAHPHLARCREVMAGGEDWRGLAGHIVRAEAVVAAAEGRFETAHEQFANAVEIYRRYQVPFEEAETLHYWGRALLAAGSSVQAVEKMDAAMELYRRHGAGERWIDGVHVDRTRAGSALTNADRAVVAARTPELPARPESGNDDEHSEQPKLTGVFRQQGEYWTLSWSGSESRVKHRKGMHYIAWLLRHPGQEFAAQALVAAIEPASNSSQIVSESAGGAYTTIARGLGDAGAPLDATAKAQYRRRLEDLREELEQALQLNDPGRADKARGEIEFIQAEISAAVGLRGKDRKTASHAERSRLAVTKAIKAALNGIRNADPELARHLTVSIQTGYFCAYDPREPIFWNL